MRLWYGCHGSSHRVMPALRLASAATWLHAYLLQYLIRNTKKPVKEDSTGHRFNAGVWKVTWPDVWRSPRANSNCCNRRVSWGLRVKELLDLTVVPRSVCSGSLVAEHAFTGRLSSCIAGQARSHDDSGAADSSSRNVSAEAEINRAFRERQKFGKRPAYNRLSFS